MAKYMYPIGRKVIAFVGFGAIEGKVGYVDANFYYGTITGRRMEKVIHTAIAPIPVYDLEYVNDDGETKSVTVMESELNFVHMTVR